MSDGDSDKNDPIDQDDDQDDQNNQDNNDDDNNDQNDNDDDQKDNDDNQNDDNVDDDDQDIADNDNDNDNDNDINNDNDSKVLSEEEVENNHQDDNKFNLSIGDESGLDDNEKLRRWKKKSDELNEMIKKLRARNNQHRNRLKKMGDKAEALVQQNLRRQKLEEQKQANKHSYLTEQKILNEMIKYGKPAADFKEYLDPEISEYLLKVHKQKQSNEEMKQKIQQIKNKNKNLDFYDQICDAQNQVTRLQRQLNQEKEKESNLNILVKEQELEILQMQKIQNFDNKIIELQNKIKKTKTQMKELKDQELVNQARYRQQNKAYLEIQAEYRKECEKQNKRLQDKNFIKDNKQSGQDDQKSKSKIAQYDEMVSVGNFKGRIKQKESKQQDKDKEQQLIEEYDEEKFQQLKEQVQATQKSLSEISKKFISDKQKLIDEAVRLTEERNELQKQYQRKEFDTKVQVSKLNEIKRKLLIVDKKPIIVEQIESQILGRQQIQLYGITEQTDSCIQFDDSKYLDWSYKPLKVSQIIVYQNERDFIYGLEIKYGGEGDLPKSTKHVGTMEKIDNKTQFDIENDDQLNYVSGFYNNEQIIFLKFETKQKKSISIGNVKNKTSQSKDFRIEITKDQDVLGFTGILDYTQESKTADQRFLVALGLQIKNKELGIGEKKKIRRQKQEEQRTKVNQKELLIRYRNYKLKKDPNLDSIRSQPALLDRSHLDYSIDGKKKLIPEEKIKLEKVRLGLHQHDIYKPESYKSTFLEEEKKRKAMQDERTLRVNKYREDQLAQSSKLLPQLQQQDPKKSIDPKKDASPKKSQPAKAQPQQKNQQTKKK